MDNKVKIIMGIASVVGCLIARKIISDWQYRKMMHDNFEKLKNDPRLKNIR